MKTFAKVLTSVAAAALVTVSTTAPAEARHRDDGIDAGDIITGVAIIGGIAAIAAALDRDGRTYGYDYRDRYRYGYQNAVNACGYYAERYGGRVRITDVDRRGSNSFRVRGVVDRDYGYDRYDRYDRNDLHDRYDPYDRYDRYDDRYGRYGYGDRGRYGDISFRCTARANGRVTDFDVDRHRYW